MDVETSSKSGSLEANLVSVRMDIDDDDDDVIIAIVSVGNEATVPIGGLNVSVITNSGAKHESKEGVSSLGPGIERVWTFEFPLSSGGWTFVLKGSSNDIKMGPFDSAFKYAAPKGRKLGNTMGSSMFTGAFNDDLTDFGQTKEREMIDSTKVVMTKYDAENIEGGETLIVVNDDLLSTGMTASSGDSARTPPPTSTTQIREAPLTSLSRIEDPLLAHTSNSLAKRESPVGHVDEPEPQLVPLPPKPFKEIKPELTPDPLGPPAGPPTPPSTPPEPPASPPTGPPPSTPPTPPSTPPTPPNTPPTPPSTPPTPPKPPAGPPTGPPTNTPTPPSTPPTGPPTNTPTPPSTPPTGPPTNTPTPPSTPPTPPKPPAGPPAGPPVGPPSGPPAGPPSSE